MLCALGKMKDRERGLYLGYLLQILGSRCFHGRTWSYFSHAFVSALPWDYLGCLGIELGSRLSELDS